MPILTQPADYNGVRAALSAELDASELPDATIQLPIYQASAESYYVGRVAGSVPPVDPNNPTLNDKLACTYYTAARIAPDLPVIVTERFLDYASTSGQPAWDQVAALNWSRGDEVVETVMGLAHTENVQSLLQLAHGRRMR